MGRLALPEAGATVLPPDSAKVLAESGRRYERYVVTLSQRLKSIADEVVQRVDQPEALDAYAKALQQREMERSRALAPVLLTIRRTISVRRSSAGAMLPGLTLWDSLLTVELESFRDARLLIEFKKARVLNGGQPARKSIRSGVEVRLYFTGLRTNAASTN